MFKLASRKLQYVNGSLLVVLPKRWIENKHLEKGDEVSCLLNQRGDLVITPVGTKSK